MSYHYQAIAKGEKGLSKTRVCSRRILQAEYSSCQTVVAKIVSNNTISYLWTCVGDRPSGSNAPINRGPRTNASASNRVVAQRWINQCL